MALREYRVYGPFDVEPNHQMQFSAREADGFTELADKFGCYVYATVHGETYTPWYAGKTKRSFRKEIFTPHKQAKLANIWDNFKNGRLVVFLIAPTTGPGRPNLKAVRDMEKFLINASFAVNERLVNIQDLRRPAWQISGVTASRPGHPGNAAMAMKRMLQF